MVDRYAKALLRLRDRQNRSRISDWQATSLEATMARMYADDVDIIGGAISAQRCTDRPGQRDDSIGCAPTALLPIL